MNRGWVVLGWASLVVVPVLGQVTEQNATQTPPAATAPADRLQNSDAKVRAKAVRELGKASDPDTVPVLARALSDSSPSVRHEAVLALAQIRAPAALGALVTATRDADPDVRQFAVKGVVGYYTGITPQAGFTSFVRKQYRRAKGHFVVDTLQIDPGVKVDPKVATALVGVLNDAAAAQPAREAAKGLGILLARSAVPNLIQAAHSPDEDLDREALNALSKIKDTSAGPQLIDLLDSGNTDVRRDDAVTLGILRTHEVLPKLQAMFENDPDQKDKEKALEGLAYLGDPVSVPLFTQALWREDKALRTSGAEGLARAGDPKALPELEKAASVEKDAGVRLAHDFALAALGKDDYLAAMVHQLGSRMRGDVAVSYLRELSRDSNFLPRLYPFLSEEDATVRRKLCTVLMFTGNAASLAHLERLSHDPNNEVASEAIRAMRAIRARG